MMFYANRINAIIDGIAAIVRAAPWIAGGFVVAVGLLIAALVS